MKIEEKISLTCGRDGGLQNMELHGMIMLHISDEKFARIRLHVENEDKRGVQLQVKPVWCPVLTNVLLLLSGVKFWKYSGVLLSYVLVQAFAANALKVGVVTADSINAGPAHTQKTEVHLRNRVLRTYLYCTWSLICPVTHVGTLSDLTWTLQQPGALLSAPLREASCAC